MKVNDITLKSNFFSCVDLPAIVCVTVYFEKLRSLATGIAVCGSGFGTVVFAPLTNYLIQTYKWQGACLVISVIVFFCAIFGWMFRPLRELEEIEEEENLRENNNINHRKNNSECLDVSQNFLSPNDGHQQIIRSQSIGNEMIKKGNANGSVEKRDVNTSRMAPSFSQPLLKDMDKSIKTSYSGSGTLARPDIFYTGSTHTLASHHKSHASIHAEGDRYGSMRARNDGHEAETTSELCGCMPCSGMITF